VGRNVTVCCCAQRGIVRRQAARLLAASVAAIALGLSVGPVARAAVDHEAVYSFAGTVLDPQGKPVAGARVWFDYALARSPAQPVPADAVTDAEGRFHFTRAKSSLSDMHAAPSATIGVLVATKESFGFAAGTADRFETTGRLAFDRPKLFYDRIAQAQHEARHKEPVLRLVPDDLPLRGQITNSEGKPVTGATVEVVSVWAGDNGSLDAWEARPAKTPPWQSVSRLYFRYQGTGEMSYLGRTHSLGVEHRLWDLRAVPVPPVTSDGTGRFTLTGIGRERIVEILVQAKGLETVYRLARTRAGRTLEMRFGKRPKFGEIAPAECLIALESSLSLQGRVVESVPARALAGVQVVAKLSRTARTVTNAQGRYRLDGLPVGDVVVDFLPPSGTRNLPLEVRLSTSDGTKVQDIALTAGVLIHGRVIDERTAKPVVGMLNYYAWATNPELRKVKELNSRSRVPYVQTDAEGRFAIAGLAGPGILAFAAGPQFRFGVGTEQIKCPSDNVPPFKGGGKIFRTIPGPCMSGSYNLLVPVNPPSDAEEIAVDLKLRSGADVTARVRTSDAQPLGTYYVLGTEGRDDAWREQNEDRFTIVGCFPDEKRRLFLYQPARNLVASADVTGVPGESIEIRLQPGGTVVGRLLDERGEPLEGALLAGDGMPLRVKVGHLAELRGDRGIVPILSPFLATAANGRFEIKGFIPGLKYSAFFVFPLRSGPVIGPRIVPIVTNVTFKSGETQDVGDVGVTPLQARRAIGRHGL
jgi:hypothetical protein